MERRCHGRNKNLSRCARYGEWRYFCADHTKQPLVALYVFVFTILTGGVTFLSELREQGIIDTVTPVDIDVSDTSREVLLSSFTISEQSSYWTSDRDMDQWTQTREKLPTLCTAMLDINLQSFEHSYETGEEELGCLVVDQIPKEYYEPPPKVTVWTAGPLAMLVVDLLNDSETHSRWSIWPWNIPDYVTEVEAVVKEWRDPLNQELLLSKVWPVFKGVFLNTGDDPAILTSAKFQVEDYGAIGGDVDVAPTAKKIQVVERYSVDLNKTFKQMEGHQGSVFYEFDPPIHVPAKSSFAIEMEFSSSAHYASYYQFSIDFEFTNAPTISTQELMLLGVPKPL